MTSYPHVALIVETSKQYDRGLLRGVGRYVKGHGPWSIYIEERGARDATPAWIRGWKGNGIIARIKDAAMAAALLATGVPIVELRAVVDIDLPTVYCDDDDYEVSCKELDAVVEVAQSIGPRGGVFGCRMTGGGFGGCAVALVKAGEVDCISKLFTEGYERKTRTIATIFATRPASGARILTAADFK